MASQGSKNRERKAVGRRSADVRVREDLRKSQEELAEVRARLAAAEKERDLAIQRNESLLDLYMHAADAAEKQKAGEQAVKPFGSLKDLKLGGPKSCVRCGAGGLVFEFEGKSFCRSCLGKEHPLLA